METIAEKLTKLNKDLRELAPQITKAMRMQWAVDNNTSLATVDRYLNGQAKMTIVAERLLNDMKELLNIPVA
jgi:hypothetical protein